jgi:hypothetical protein
MRYVTVEGNGITARRFDPGRGSPSRLLPGKARGRRRRGGGGRRWRALVRVVPGLSCVEPGVLGFRDGGTRAAAPTASRRRGGGRWWLVGSWRGIPVARHRVGGV